MKWSDFEARITGAMLGDKSYTLTVTEVVIEDVHPRPGVTSKAPVLHFAETPKSLVLSTTNCRKMAALFGDDISGCRGKRIVISAQQMRVAGRDTTPVRIVGVGTPKTEKHECDPSEAHDSEQEVEDVIEETEAGVEQASA